ncbi:ankyrin repeat domain-containing protein [Candidatus Dependentiae bacterium]
MKRQILSITMLLAICSANMFAGDIWDAITDGDVKRVTQLIGENQEVVNEVDGGGLTPLSLACHKNNLEIVTLLLPKCTKVTINEADNYDQTPLYLACCNDNLEIATLLLPKCTKETINKANKSDQTPLFCACCNGNGDLKIVKLLLPHCTKETINKADNDGDTPLLSACWKGNLEIVELLLLNGATVRQKDIRATRDQAIKNYLGAVLEYVALEKNKLQDKITFINSKRNKQNILNFLIKLSLSRSIEEVIKNQKHLKDTVAFKLCDQLYDKKVLDGAITEAQNKICRLDMKEMAVRFEKTIKDQLANQLKKNKNYLNVMVTCVN